MGILDKPLTVIFPELNSLQIGWIRELMKREYERGLADRPFTISVPTTTQYTANAEARSPLENQRGTKRINEVKDDN